MPALLDLEKARRHREINGDHEAGLEGHAYGEQGIRRLDRLRAPCPSVDPAS